MTLSAYLGSQIVGLSAVDNNDGTYSLKVSGGGGGGGGGGGSDRELVITTYRAKASGTGFSVGDTITAIRYINVSTGSPAQEGATAWYNETTSSAISAPGAANIELAGTPGLTDAQLRAAPVRTGAQRVTMTDRSGTIATGGSSQPVMSANGSRDGFFVQNLSDGDIYINDLGAASATQPSLRIPPGMLYESPMRGVTTAAVAIFGATTGQAFAAREW